MLVRFLIAALAALTISAANASPIVKRQAGVTPNTATCQRSDTTGWGGEARQKYTLTVARPYDEGSGCDNIKLLLDDAIPFDEGIDDYRCGDNYLGNTYLSFTIALTGQPWIYVTNGLEKVR